ncbi:hypothetical protein KFU94_22855 [Chloroflexi bacterium TSY]|nr:hypothetical protein [Chloroflexi bacterium TSY]
MRPQSTPGRLRRVLSSALFQLLTNSTLTFGKRPRFHTIYLKAFSLIAASMPLLKLAEHYFYILSRFFRVDSFFRPFRFALCHSSLYQKVKFNDAEASAEYAISVEGGVLIDRLVQTNESVAAQAELAAIQAAESGGTPIQPASDADSLGSDRSTQQASLQEISATPSAVGASELTDFLIKAHEHRYFELFPKISDGFVRVTMAYDTNGVDVLDEDISFWILDDDGLRRVIGGSRPADVNIASGSLIQLGPEKGKLGAAFKSSGRGRYTIIVYKNTDIPITYTLQTDGAVLGGATNQDGLAVSLP